MVPSGSTEVHICDFDRCSAEQVIAEIPHVNSTDIIYNKVVKVAGRNVGQVGIDGKSPIERPS